MRLLYATSITLPSYRANRIQVVSMAQAWARLLGKDFVLGVGSTDNSLQGVPVIVMGEGIRSYHLAWKYLLYAKGTAITHTFCREEKLLFFMILFNKFFFRLPIKFCYEIHHLVYMDSWWHKLVLTEISYVISITAIMKDVLMRYRYPEERILVAPDATDLALFDIRISREEAREKLGLPLDKKIIIYTGTVHEPWKGVGILFAAAKTFDDSYLFLVLGGKPHYVDIFHETYGEQSNFLLLGHKLHAEIPLYLKAADVAILPNSAKSEISRISTSPMKLFEYMAAGVPIVASDLPSIREVLNEQNALLVSSDDAQALARGIRTILADKTFGATLSEQAHKDVSTRTWVARAEQISAFIQ